eukprot:scaffold111786_cov63-Phaeocystis_antarctica.AAC.1
MLCAVQCGGPDAELRAGRVAVTLHPLRVLCVLGSEAREVAQHRVVRVTHAGSDARGTRAGERAVGRQPAGVSGHADEPHRRHLLRGDVRHEARPGGAEDLGLGEERARRAEDAAHLEGGLRRARVVGPDEAGEGRARGRDERVVGAGEAAVRVERRGERYLRQRVMLRAVVQHEDLRIRDGVVPAEHGGVLSADKLERHRVGVGAVAAHVGADAQRGDSGAAQQRDARAREARHVDVRPDARQLGQVVPLVERARYVDERLKHSRLADDARVEVHRAVGPHEIAAAHRRVEGRHLRLARAAQQAWVERAAVRHAPRHAVDVQADDPGVDGVDEAVRAVAQLVRQADRAGDEVVEVLLHDLGCEAEAELGDVEAYVEADVEVVRE